MKSTLLVLIVSLISGFGAETIPTKPLGVDVEWILQGSGFGFQGFFVEYLGFSSAMRRLLPLSRISQSSFKKSFEESGIENEDKFFNEDLFSEESSDLRSLLSKEVLDFSNTDIVFPKSKFAPPLVPDSCEARSHFEENYAYTGNSLAKFRVSSAHSEVECCQSCVSNPLCTAWTYDQSWFGCELKGGASQNGIAVEGATSGRLKNVAQQQIRASIPKVLIFHGTMCIYNNQSAIRARRDINTIFIGRFMVEREQFLKGHTVDENSVAQCAAVMDEIWVPTQWHKKVFEQWMRLMGIRAPAVEVVPEAVDTRLFDPTKAVPIRKAHPSTHEAAADANVIRSETRIFGDNNVIQDHRGKECAVIENVVKCSPEGAKFEFLSIFKWEHRKGWDILLDAYWSAFSAEDDVILRIRSYMPSFMRGETNITKSIELHAQQTLARPLSELAAVVWESGALPERRSDSLTRADVRDLLASVDAFVLPTRGEGWGLPIVEAMAMQLPVIVTNHSGPTAYATEHNSYLLPVLPELDSFGFGQPDVEQLRRLFRQVVFDSSAEGQYVAQQRGKEARLTVQRISPESVVEVMLERIKYHIDRRGWTLEK